MGGACIDGGDGPRVGSPSIPNIPGLLEWRRSSNRRQSCAMLEESERREEREDGITTGEDGCIMELHVDGVSRFWAFGECFFVGRPARSPP